MPQRRFLIAPSLARLIRKEQGVVGHVVEGYFPARSDRDLFVSIEPGHCFLVLAAGTEERTEIPRSQAEALLDVCAGQVGFACTIVRLRGGKQALLQHCTAPGSMDLLSVEFAAGEDVDRFVPPAWFGPEVTHSPAHRRGALARLGVPASGEIPLSNTMLMELLDTLEEGALAAQLSHTTPPRTPENHRADEPTQAALSETSQLSAGPGDPARREALMVGLAEALKTFDPTQPRPAAEAASVHPPRATTLHRYG